MSVVAVHLTTDGKESKDEILEDKEIKTKNPALNEPADPFPNKLPAGFTGAQGLKMPAYLSGPVASVTLPSRLDLLGRQSFKIIAAFYPLNLANSVLGYAPFIQGCKPVFGQLFVLPWIFSKAAARMNLFVRTILLAMSVILIVGFFGGTTVNPGKAWVVGTATATFVMYKLATFRRMPDGVMAFCRSMGAPEIEEYMFSYCWKVEPENVRTLAKAVWNSGVGVWIDVVKLCPGDEIRPMLRSTIKKVFRVVIFLCPEYCASPNCCVEMTEAAQTPQKLIFCILKECDKGIHDWINNFMVPHGSVVVNGFTELIRLLDVELEDTNERDEHTAANKPDPFKWWRDQKISGAGVPDHVVPNDHWSSIPKFSFWGRAFPPSKSLTIGPLYLAGDCKSTGSRFWPPWLLLLAIFAVLWNAGDLYTSMQNTTHHFIDYIWLSVISLCDLAPLLGVKNLLDTRRDAHVALKPLMASKSLKGGVKVRIVGRHEDPIAMNLHTFVREISHNPTDEGTSPTDVVTFINKPQNNRRQSELTRSNKEADERIVTVFVMNNLEDRAALFGSDDHPFDKYSLFVWSGEGDPFGKDPEREAVEGSIGKRLMRFLVLVAGWDKQLLAENLFSSISVRVVDLLHDNDEQD